ncbi:XRE family transcriptional regulator [Wolbachia endosymbiont of Folsomia candida]|uniref:XRE family transcriptional regulator n=1 Tax=Wolbachia endosymbiont of Folsomia candida TaxID=169402 RepID=UPI000B338B43|nr:XRE family transcriptional regulator [Wolbachia endosymbiont of Folsomia candida]APR98710.1 hypothetical protein ASM33_05710 [Wolbachia endosymbiont of Folsomia candida]
MKEILIQMINKAIDDNKWSSKKAAYILETPLADISRIKNLKPANFSLARLLIFLVRLDFKVRILINSNEEIEQDISFEYVISASQC